MQLKDRFQPKTVITVLLLALVMPLIVAAAQIILPASLIPGSLYSDPNRIRATFGHANVFATFLLLFIGITWWKLNHSQQRRPWFILLSLLVIFLVSTRAIFCLMMLAIIVLILTAQKANLPKVIGGIILFGLVIGLFASTEFGQERLSSIGNTPVLNPNIDIWRAILMSNSDENSFNWRLSQWYLVLQAWKQYPLLGYGLGLSSQSINSQLLPHNDYIRAMAEGGIVGLICYLSLFGIQLARLAVLFKSAPRGSAQQDFCLFLIAVIVAFMVGMITENIWSHTVFFMYFSVMQAIAGWDWLTPQTSQSSDVSRLSLEAKLIS
jgi:O-antigen ligase